MKPTVVRSRRSSGVVEAAAKHPIKSVITEFDEFYADPEMYDDTFSGGSEGEVEFYVELVKRAKHVLYLGSGSGRLFKEFLKVNKNVVGVEIQKEMVEFCRKLLPTAKVIQGDALTLDLKDRFDLIIAPYLFTCHFEPAQAQKLFNVIAKHLEVGGTFAGDMFSPYLPHDRTIKGEVDWIDIQGDVVTKVFCLYDHDEQICTEYVEKNNAKTHDYSMIGASWHYYYPEQLKKMMAKAGISVKKWYGTFLKDEMNKENPELIWIANKRSR
jgi:SAM-dependent methyltransferase